MTRIYAKYFKQMLLKLRIWETCEMVFITKRLIQKCVIPQMIMQNVLLMGLDLILIMTKEVKKKLKQDMMTKKQ